jgi:hypothetical protein
VTDLLTELKDLCQGLSAASDDEIIARGESTWFRGLPAHAEKGTVALGLGRDARVVISEQDIRAVTKDGDHYSVEASSEANVLLRIEKPLKATVQPECGCDENDARTHQTRSRRKPIIDVEVGPIEVCELLCADIVIDNGKQSVSYEICIPVNCYTEPKQSFPE